MNELFEIFFWVALGLLCIAIAFLLTFKELKWSSRIKKQAEKELAILDEIMEKVKYD